MGRERSVVLPLPLITPGKLHVSDTSGLCEDVRWTWVNSPPQLRTLSQNIFVTMFFRIYKANQTIIGLPLTHAFQIQKSLAEGPAAHTYSCCLLAGREALGCREDLCHGPWYRPAHIHCLHELCFLVRLLEQRT